MAAFLVLPGVLRACSGKGAQTPEEAGSGDTLRLAMLRELAHAGGEKLYELFTPCLSFIGESGREAHWILREQVSEVFPLYGYLFQSGQEAQNVSDSVREILLAEAQEGIEMQEDGTGQSAGNSMGQAQDPGEAPAEGLSESAPEKSLEELLREENAAASQLQTEPDAFAPHVRQAQVELSELEDYETLLKQFYTVDSSTMAGSDQLDVKKFLEKDLTVSKEGEGPQILIFHTHSQEAFADSLPEDSASSIVGVGDRLAEILTDTWGYQVLHHTEAYDAETRNNAYSKALPDIERILEENPSIQVVIDLHRDAMPEGTRLVMDLDGKPTARFMFFNGLSRTKKTGNINYLYNENLAGNLAFSFRMQLAASEYYPGLTRKIYLKGYRYNMHLMDKYLLVELGAQNNTVEEAMNACEPLAHILDLVLSGSE